MFFFQTPIFIPSCLLVVIMATRSLTITEDETGKVRILGDRKLFSKVKIEFFEETLMNKDSASLWDHLKPSFNCPPSTAAGQTDLRNFAEAILRHCYDGEKVHWDNKKIPVVLWFLCPDPNLTQFKDNKCCNDFIEYKHMAKGFVKKPKAISSNDRITWKLLLARCIQAYLAYHLIKWSTYYWGSPAHRAACPDFTKTN